VAVPLLILGRKRREAHTRAKEMLILVGLENKMKTLAVAYLRGNPKFMTALTFEYVESYVVPKRSLTGDSTERVDTRVMQVIYSFKQGKLPVYPGQLMDIYIDDLAPRLAQPVPSVEKERKK
jgi:hypothetical protein